MGNAVIRIQLNHPASVSAEDWPNYAAHVADAVTQHWPDADVQVTETHDATAFGVQGGENPVAIWSGLPDVVGAAQDRWGV